MKIDTSTWDKVTLGDIAQSLTIATKDPLSEGLERYVGLEHIEPGNIHIKSWGNVVDGTTFTRVFRKGQVLFGKRRAYQKKAAMAEFDGVCSGDILVCEAIKDAVVPELLPFIVQSDRFFEHAIKTSAGSLSPRTKFKDLAKFTFKLPAKPVDQKRIADLLWSIDVAVEKWKLLNSWLDILQKAILKEKIFTQKMPLKKIGDFGDVVTGKTPSTKNHRFWNGGVPFVTPSDMSDENKYVDRTERYITDEALRESKKIPVDSLLVVCIASIGKLAISTKECITNQQINAVMGNKVDMEYLYYVLRGNPELLKRMAGHSVVPIIKKSLFEVIEVPYLPDFADREKIVTVMSQMNKQKAEVTGHILKSKELRKDIVDQIFG